MRLLLFSIMLGFFLHGVVRSQEKATPLAEFISQADLIIVAKCAAVGPVNIIGISRIDVEVVHVLKGKPVTHLSYGGRGSLKPGKFYLIRFPGKKRDENRAPSVREFATVIEISSESEANGLNQFPLEIAILRTTNLRVDHLESQIRGLTYELDELKKLKKDN